jgi:hypothetical protein
LLGEVYFDNHLILIEELGQLSQYSAWLQTGWSGNQGLIPGRGKGFFFYLLCPDQFWDPSSLLSNRFWGPSPRGKARPGHDIDHSPLSSARVKNE